MKNTIRDWIQARPTRSGISVTIPPTPVAAPSTDASVDVTPARHLAERVRLGAEHPAAPVGPARGGRRVLLGRGQRDVLRRAQRIGAQSLPQVRRRLLGRLVGLGVDTHRGPT